MNSLDREVLRKHRVYLVKELMVDVLWPSLVEHGIFTDEMLEHIKATGARPSQVHRLLSDLTRRGPKAFAKFLECLVETDQSHVAERLREAADVMTDAEPRFETRRSYGEEDESSRRDQMRTGTTNLQSSPLLTAASLNLSSRGPADAILRSGQLGNAVVAVGRPPPLPQLSSVAAAEFAPPPSFAARVAGWSGSSDDDGSGGGSSSSNSSGGSPRLGSYTDDDVPSPVQLGAGDRPSGRRGTTKAPARLQQPPRAVGHDRLASNAAYLPSTKATAGVVASPPPLAQLNRGGGHAALPEPSFDGEALRAVPLIPMAATTTAMPRLDDVVTLGDDGGGARLLHPTSAAPASCRGGGEQPDGPADVGCSSTVASCGGGAVALGSTVRTVIASSKSARIAVDDLVTPNWNKVYKMTSNPRGYCVIISNRYFSGHLRERIGTDVDKDNLYRLFSQLGYMISIKENLTALEILITLRDFALLDNHRSVDSCAVALLTHGLDGQVYGCDCRLVDLSEAFSFFDGHHCPALKGKPKIMVVQACRGERYDVGFETTDSPGSELHGSGHQGCDAAASSSSPLALGQSAADDESWAKKLPSCSDFLIAYATIPGHVSWRNSEEGSWFVKAFCEVFSRNAHHDDATSMLVEVNDKVATAYESATGHKQMPAPVVLLRKKLYFYPPLISPSMLTPR